MKFSLTKNNANLIKVGSVLRFHYPNGTERIGVVYTTPEEGSWGVLCNDQEGNYFGHAYNNDIGFEVVKDHEPVAKVGLQYKFV